MFKEFKEFAIKGNMIDLAIGVIMGGAFGGVVNSLVKDVIMPPVGALLGGVDFASKMWVIKEGVTAAPYATPAAAAEAGAVVMSYGAFINTIINFLIVAFAIFMVVKVMNRLRRQEEEAATVKECQYCKSEIALEASRCPACTSEL
ncbi:MAG: large-conductance mechanosensitive channel protein MscL [Actinobacteria bacterium]|nr:large-conductance mechanosensitive channel protein MscL [Actinomycetota bacterium]